MLLHEFRLGNNLKRECRILRKCPLDLRNVYFTAQISTDSRYQNHTAPHRNFYLISTREFLLQSHKKKPQGGPSEERYMHCTQLPSHPIKAIARHSAKFMTNVHRHAKKHGLYFRFMKKNKSRGNC